MAPSLLIADGGNTEKFRNCPLSCMFFFFFFFFDSRLENLSLFSHQKQKRRTRIRLISTPVDQAYYIFRIPPIIKATFGAEATKI